MPAPRDDVNATPVAVSQIAVEPVSDAACTLAFRRSLRVSRSRRAGAVRRRRRVVRGRGSTLVAAMGSSSSPLVRSHSRRTRRGAV